jgi:myo-inositol-1(or 4)-monophosphatase
MTGNSRQDDIELLTAAVREAGDIAHKYFTRADVKTWDKNPGNPVTEADLAVDAHLKERLCAARPDYAWLSEETADDKSRLSADRVWIVDPIDGTRAFVKKKPEYTVCAALVENGRAVLGAVLNPETNEFYVAEAGRGATLNGAPLRISAPPPIEQSSLLTSRQTLERYGPSPIPTANFTFFNSIAYRMVMVADGRYHAAVSVKAKCDWDIAAADLIATESGLIVSAPDGAALVYNRPDVRHTGIIVAAEPLYADIMTRLEGFPLSLGRD